MTAGTPVVAGRRTRPPRRAGLVVGVVVVVAYLAAAVFAPLIAPYDPLQQNIPAALSAPSLDHPLGTDNLGRDALSRLLHAARLDLLLGVAAAVLAFALGGVVGLVAGYAGGWIDLALTRIMDIFQVLPTIVLLIVLLLLFGSSATGIVLALVAGSWVSYARIIRSGVFVAVGQDYALAARLAGLSHGRVLVRHVLPNVWVPAFIYMTSDIVIAIGAIAALGYLGIGIQPPTPEWGQMIASGQVYLQSAPWLTVAPGLTIALLGLALALLSDALTGLMRRS